jgi:hypothetical protein
MKLFLSADIGLQPRLELVLANLLQAGFQAGHLILQVLHLERQFTTLGL